MSSTKTVLKLPAKILIGVILFGGLFAYLYSQGYLSRPGTVSGSLPATASLPELNQPVATSVARLPLPSSDVAHPGQPPKIRIRHYAWNAHSALILANGGVRTTKGSLVDLAGTDLELGREDVNDKLLAAMVSAAKTDGREGSPCITLMGDGTPAFLSGANPQLAREAGPDSVANIYATFGFSHGEDGLWGPAEWIPDPGCKDSVDAPTCQHPDWGPVKARGALIAVVLRDGDQNIGLKWAVDNGLCSNPNEGTWDPDCINWLGTESFTGPGGTDEKYITGPERGKGVCVDLKVVRGPNAGKTERHCVTAAATWTPGDVNIATKKGGIVPIVTTREYSSQMPCTLLCVKKWTQAHRQDVLAVLRAAFQAADQINSYPDALRRAAELSAALYGEQTPDYWEKYFKGVTETDKTGVPVRLGGSLVNNLNTNLNVFGIAAGSTSVFAAVYTTFGEIQKSQYPKYVGSYPPASQVIDLSLLQELATAASSSAPAAIPTYAPGGQIQKTVGRRSWDIEFMSGSSVPTGRGLATLEELSNSLLANELVIELHGHTDNVGDPASNMNLSLQRALAIKSWLMKKSVKYFPDSRFVGPQSGVFPHGQTRPVATNADEAGRSKNRRVEVLLGTQ